MMDLKNSETMKNPKWVKHPKIFLKLQIPYYQLLNEWLLGVTNGNQGQTMMDLKSSKIIKHFTVSHVKKQFRCEPNS